MIPLCQRIKERVITYVYDFPLGGFRSSLVALNVFLAHFLLHIQASGIRPPTKIQSHSYLFAHSMLSPQWLEKARCCLLYRYPFNHENRVGGTQNVSYIFWHPPHPPTNVS